MKPVKPKFQLLVKAVDELGYEYRSYSGRFMYGKSCLGINIESGVNTYAVVAEITQYLLMELSDECVAECLYVNEIFCQTKIHNLGLGYILYFPNIEVSNETV